MLETVLMMGRLNRDEHACTANEDPLGRMDFSQDESGIVQDVHIINHCIEIRIAFRFLSNSFVVVQNSVFRLQDCQSVAGK